MTEPIGELTVEVGNLPDPARFALHEARNARPAPPRARSRQPVGTVRSRMLDKHNESRFAGEVAQWERETGLDYYNPEELDDDAVRVPESQEPAAPDAAGEPGGPAGDTSAGAEAADPAEQVTGDAPASEGEEPQP